MGRLLRHTNRILNRFGYKLETKGLEYLDPVTTVRAARDRNLDVCEYLEGFNIAGVGRRRDAIIAALRPSLPQHLDAVLEIGAGTGMFLEKILDLCSPQTYEVYETSVGWVAHLEEQYSRRTQLRCYDCDGMTLRNTKTASVDAVFAHGVFVYLPLIVTFGYLEEAVRVLAPGGSLIFDCFLGERFGVDVIKQWQNDPYKWSFPVVISEGLIGDFADRYGLTLVNTFDIGYHASFSTYFVYRR
jgi:SAM-dependent methyltransferase